MESGLLADMTTESGEGTNQAPDDDTFNAVFLAKVALSMLSHGVVEVELTYKGTTLHAFGAAGSASSPIVLNGPWQETCFVSSKGSTPIRRLLDRARVKEGGIPSSEL
jgi:hypothetical protein